MSTANLRVIPGGARPMRDASGRPPPHDLGAERVVLGDMLVAPENVPVVRGLLRPGDFYAVEHAAICEALYALDDEDVPIDASLVGSWLRDREKLTKETLKALAIATDATPRVANVEAHALVVRGKSRLRKAIKLHHEKLAEAYGDLGCDEQTWIERCAGDFSELAIDHAGDGAVDANQAASDAALRREETKQRIARGEGLSTYLEKLDEYTGGLHRGEVTMVVAETGGGKSAFCGHMMFMVAGSRDASGEQRKAGLMFSLEMPREDVIERWACALTGVDYGRVRRNELTHQDEDLLVRGFDAISRLPLHIDDRGHRGQAMSFDAIRAETLRQKALLAKRGQRLDLVIIDYFQLIDWRPDAGYRGSAYTGLNEIGKRIKLLAERAQVAILLPAQLNKDNEIRDCPSQKHHAQNMWQVILDDEDETGMKTARVRIRKQRHGPTDVEAGCWFDGPRLRFTDNPYRR